VGYGGGERPPPGQAFAMELPGMCNVPQGGATQMPQRKQLEAELAIILLNYFQEIRIGTASRIHDTK